VPLSGDKDEKARRKMKQGKRISDCGCIDRRIPVLSEKENKRKSGIGGEKLWEER
jgi:hypothetical protein